MPAHPRHPATPLRMRTPRPSVCRALLTWVAETPPAALPPSPSPHPLHPDPGGAHLDAQVCHALLQAQLELGEGDDGARHQARLLQEHLGGREGHRVQEGGQPADGLGEKRSANREEACERGHGVGGRGGVAQRRTPASAAHSKHPPPHSLCIAMLNLRIMVQMVAQIQTLRAKTLTVRCAP